MIREPREHEIFVFGSNTVGLHGGGAARFAFENFGAVWGDGHGLRGHSYAIDTMSGLTMLRNEVTRFLGFAREHPELRLLVTELGCGTAGYSRNRSARCSPRTRPTSRCRQPLRHGLPVQPLTPRARG